MVEPPFRLEHGAHTAQSCQLQDHHILTNAETRGFVIGTALHLPGRTLSHLIFNHSQKCITVQYVQIWLAFFMRHLSHATMTFCLLLRGPSAPSEGSMLDSGWSRLGIILT